ncbi:pancreatic lipase-related protein 3-like [Portunus trituberculatus]|uniref:pancreatic lipase-related protein 3-like n=1 Tax=Portunus trituberculatus TaxID=210409 RepID=UPI001E1D07CD|nr:pancreatic lipase-related protein 3-like [Portunus trituberculatus]
MDPAGPFFYNVTEEHRLDPSDAEFVQVIHTDACSILTVGIVLGEGRSEGKGGHLTICLGMRMQMGHVDFYPNGGKYQPACSFGFTGAGEARGCNHDVAQKYWLESINGETPFLAHPCQDWDAFQAGLCDTCGKGCLQMGFHVNKNLTGTYYLRTNSASPFAMG